MSNKSDYNTESYADNDDILFRHVLLNDERKNLVNISYNAINNYTSSKDSKAYVISKSSEYNNLLKSLTQFFDISPGSYFLRLSTLSPKDAYYYLNRDDISYDDLKNLSEVDETANEIKNSLDILKVSSPIECIQLLCHSFRVLCELDEYNLDENAVLLMPWKNIVHDSETRCFVKNKKLVCFSQYYTDCVDSYSSIVLIDDFYKKIIQFVTDLILNKKNLPEDFVIDVSQKINSTDLIMIELNIYDRNTDSCLFSWDEIDQLYENNKCNIFRYNMNKTLFEILN